MILHQWLLFTKNLHYSTSPSISSRNSYILETQSLGNPFCNPQCETLDPLQTFFQIQNQHFIIHELCSHLDITSQPNSSQHLILSPVIQYQALLSIVRGTLNTPRAIPAPVARFHSSTTIYVMYDIALGLWVSTQFNQYGTRRHLWESFGLNFKLDEWYIVERPKFAMMIANLNRVSRGQLASCVWEWCLLDDFVEICDSRREMIGQE
jgi:hypothetical protein